MRHFLRIGFLSILVFLAISAYFLIPKPGDFWESASRRAVARGDRRPRLSIFLKSTEKAEEPPPALPPSADSRGLPPVTDPEASGPPSADRQERSASVELPAAVTAYVPEELVEREGDDTGSDAEGGPSAETPDRVTASYRPYTVQKGDTLGHIAARVLGSVRFVKGIRALNPALRERDQLQVGQTIKLPLMVVEEEEGAEEGTTDTSARESAKDDARKAPDRAEAARALSPAPPPRAQESGARKQATEGAAAKAVPRVASSAAAGKPRPRPEATPRGEKERAAEVTVKKGDTWYNLAVSHLGGGKRWPEIFAANRDRLGPGDPLIPGTKIRIPRAAKSE